MNQPQQEVPCIGGDTFPSSVSEKSVSVDFHKYHGTSNDFIIIDNRQSVVSLDSDQISRLCNRRTGIGADGVLLLEEEEGFDFRMVYYNSDGTQSMCGNGGRCIAQFAFDRGLRPAGGDWAGGCVQFLFTAVDGPHCAEVDPASGLVRLALGDVAHVEYSPSAQQQAAFCVIDTGSPHYVVLPPAADGHNGVPALAALDVVKLGREIRHSPRFAAKGINVNFLELVAPPWESKSESVVGIRTFERGVEDETFSCGTGCAAAAIAHVHRRLVDGSGAGAAVADGAFVVRMRARGGDLTIRLHAHTHSHSRAGDTGAANAEGGDFSYSDVWLEGPAVFSFRGSVLL